MAAIQLIFPESFTPPESPDHRAATTSRRPPPRTILLDLDAYLVDRRNPTTATATSRLGHTVQVTIHAAADPPPAMSHLCVHCPCSNNPSDPAFAFEPRVVGAEGRFVLLHVRFADAGGHHDDDDDEYFVYKADPTNSPSLERVKRRPRRLPLSEQIAVVPLADADGQYLLAGRSSANLNRPFKYQLHVYSSADRTWRIRPMRNACPDPGRIIFTNKVISLGDGVVGWVDLRVGVLVCDLNLLRQSPSASVDCLDVRFIPLPVPMPGNRERLTEFHPGDPAWRLRDVASSRSRSSSNGDGGVLKFVEIEHRWIVTTIAPEPEPTTDPSDKAVLLDSDLIASLGNRKRVDTKPRQVRKRDGWSMMTWSRTMASDCWRKGCVVDVDDIAVDDAIASALRSAVAGDEDDRRDDDERFRFRNLFSAFPTLSTDADDLVYLKAKAKVNGPKGWMVAVDLGKKTLTALGGEYLFARHDPCTYNDCICLLSSYLNMDPDSSQTTKPKDSADPLKQDSKSSAEEASCPYKDKPRDARLRLQLELKAQDRRSNSIKEQHGAESNEECSSDSSGPLPPPPLVAIPRNCLPPRPVIKQSDGAGDRPNPADLIPVNNAVVARPTGSSLPPQPQVPVSVPVPMSMPPQQQQVFGQWSGAVNHPNDHVVVNHHHLHESHDATGLIRSYPPPQPVLPQQNMSHWNNGVSYQYQNHPWPPPDHHQPQAQQWNGAATGWYQGQQHPYTHGVNQNQHWNAAANGYYYPPSANANLQNQWMGGVVYGYGHHSDPNLLACAAGQFPNQPGGALPGQQTANQLRGGAPEQQWAPAGSAGDAAQAWTPRKRWRGAE